MSGTTGKTGEDIRKPKILVGNTVFARIFPPTDRDVNKMIELAKQFSECKVTVNEIDIVWMHTKNNQAPLLRLTVFCGCI